MSTPRDPRRNEPLSLHLATRGKILHAAAELARQQGFEGTSMAQVAQRAGVSTETLHRHFRDHRALLLELFEYWSAGAIV